MATMNQLENPLSKADLSNLSKALYDLNVAMMRAEKAKEAGFDMEEELLRIHHRKTQIEQILATYQRS